MLTDKIKYSCRERPGKWDRYSQLLFMEEYKYFFFTSLSDKKNGNLDILPLKYSLLYILITRNTSCLLLGLTFPSLSQLNNMRPRSVCYLNPTSLMDTTQRGSAELSWGVGAHREVEFVFFPLCQNGQAKSSCQVPIHVSFDFSTGKIKNWLYGSDDVIL